MKKKFNAPGKKINNKWVIVSIGAIVVVTFGIGGWYYYTSTVSDKPIENTTINQSQDNENKVVVLLTNTTMLAGDYMESTSYDLVEYAADQVPDDAILDPSELSGKVLKNDLEQGNVIRRKDLLYKMPYEEDDRFVEINFIDGAIPTTIPDEQLIGTIVDINMFRQGAVDEIVISKATIIAKDVNKLAFYLNPTEKEYIKEASVEGTLYLTGYAEKNQKASEVTYRPGYLK